MSNENAEIVASAEQAEGKESVKATSSKSKDKKSKKRNDYAAGPSKQGAFLTRARKITLAAVFVAVIISLAFDSGLGTPSSFGIGEFFLLCPLGGIEAMLASRSFIPVTAISLVVVLVFVLVFGRAWCAWGCPAPVIRSFFRRQAKPESVDEHSCFAPKEAWSLAKSFARIGRDPRTWALVGVLAVTFAVGFPLFCLVCPIGLTFGTVGSLWHLIVDKQVTMSVIVFPLALVVELVLYRKWCLNLCPIAGLLNIFGQFAVLFRPRIDSSTCLRYDKNSHQCNVCAKVCSEHINLHAPDAVQQLAECTRCGECVKHCPTASITIKAASSDPVVKR